VRRLDVGELVAERLLEGGERCLAQGCSGHAALQSAWSTFPDYASTRIEVRSVAPSAVSDLTREQVRLRRLVGMVQHRCRCAAAKTVGDVGGGSLQVASANPKDPVKLTPLIAAALLGAVVAAATLLHTATPSILAESTTCLHETEPVVLALRYLEAQVQSGTTYAD
jgi:hypothetical protein